MDLVASDSWLPGAAFQLTALLAALGGVLAVTLLLVGWLGWRAGRSPGAADPEPVPDAPQPSSPLAAIRLLGAAVIAVLVLPAAALVRQLWPHPELGRPLLLGWLAVLLASMLAWVAVALADRSRER